MSKQWFLIKSLGATVDLSLVSQVIWNYVSSEQRVHTKFYLGTSVAFDPETACITGNEWWVYDPVDRKKLQAALRVLGLPTVELVFDSNKKLRTGFQTVFQHQETVEDYAGEATLDRYIDPEELNVDR